MADSFRITFDVDRVDCDPRTDNVEAFAEYVLRGAVTIFSGDRAFRIWPCGILRVSRSLIRLCTFPVLYGVKADETVLDHGIDFRSTYENGGIVLEIIRLGREQEGLVLSLSSAEALQVVGNLHKRIMLEIFRKCPKIIDETQLLLKIPDGFALAHLARVGDIGSDSAAPSA